MPSRQQPGSRQWADGLDPAAAGAAPGCPLWRCVGLCCRGVGTPHSWPSFAPQDDLPHLCQPPAAARYRVGLCSAVRPEL
ncbi:Uncharacterised protein [Chlamydia abortus]|nr:Uncharacterised protein [Chlamydia abortus]